MITAKIIEHSSYEGKELITIETNAPKFLDAEIEKHRMISSNSSSDRAIPSDRLINSDFFIPEDIRINEKGMQGNKKLPENLKIEFQNDIIDLREYTIEFMNKWKQVHKQHINRYYLPFSYQKKVMTANKDQWEYFLSLRLHKDADPSIYKLAEEIDSAIKLSEPKNLKVHEWHLPYITEEEKVNNGDLNELLKISSARCARISYNNFNGKLSKKEEDIKLFNFLINETLPHATPTEHQAKPMPKRTNLALDGISHIDSNGVYYSGNFHSFIQFRKILEDRNWNF